MTERNVTIVLSDDQVEALDLLSREINMSRSALIRRAVITYLPQLHEAVLASKEGDWADELVYTLLGNPIRKTGDSSDQQFDEALRALRARSKANRKKLKRRPGRPPKKAKGGSRARTK